MNGVYWTCPVCEHEAMDYDEVDHECIDENTGKPKDYVAQGDELASKYEALADSMEDR